MERLKYVLPILVLLSLVVAPQLALADVYRTATTTEDTYILKNFSSNGDGQKNFGNETEITINSCIAGKIMYANDSYAMFRVPTDNFTNHLISHSAGGEHYFHTNYQINRTWPYTGYYNSLYFTKDNYWTKDNITYDTYQPVLEPDVAATYYSISVLATQNPVVGGVDDLTGNLFGWIYNNTNITFVVNGELQQQSGGWYIANPFTCGVNSNSTVFSNKATISRPFNIGMDTTEFKSITRSFTNKPVFKYMVENDLANTDWTAGFDYRVDYSKAFTYTSPTTLGGNIFQAHVPAFTLRTRGSTPDNIVNSPDVIQQCSTANAYIYNPTIYGTLTNYAPNGSLYYDVYCLNLSVNHMGKPFYAAVLFTNATQDFFSGNTQTNFYASVWSPKYVIFTQPVYSPNPPKYLTTLDISWSTNIQTNTFFQYRYKPKNLNYTSWVVITVPNQTVFHNVTFPASQLLIGDYQFFYGGNTSDGSFSNSSIYSFNITLFPNETNQTQITSAIEKLVTAGFVPDAQTGVYLFGIVFLAIVSFFCFAFGGHLFGLAGMLAVMIVETLVGLLPFYLIIPIILLGAIIVTHLLRKTFHGL